MESLLSKITEDVKRFSQMILDVVDMDVIIVDSQRKILSMAFRYFSLYNDIHYGSLTAEVLRENRTLLIEDKSAVENCQKCGQFKECKMTGFIGVPIRYENQAVGVIALILKKSKVKKLLQNKESTIEFVESMSYLLSSQLGKKIEQEGLKDQLTQTEAILDMMADAVVYTDNRGDIIFMNRKFKTVFQAEDSFVSRNITEIYPVFRQWYGKSLNNEKVSFDYGKGVFYGLLDSKNVPMGEHESGILFRFRPYEDISDSSRLFSRGTLVTFQWLTRYVSPELIDKAKFLAEKEEDVLIYGDDNALNEMIAKAIYNHSGRRLEGIRVIYIQNIYRDLLEEFLMDEYGVFSNMDGGTVIIVQPEKMPLSMQEKMAEFISTKEVAPDRYRSIRSDVRFIFCTEQDLEQAAKQEKFDRNLFSLISRNQIQNIETIHNNYKLFAKFVTEGWNHYCREYHKGQRALGQELIGQMWQDYREMPMSGLEKLLESMVRDGEENALEQQRENSRAEIKPLRELERKQLEQMLKNGYSKKEICEVLKLSRSTLYRRMKAYGLE